MELMARHHRGRRRPRTLLRLIVLGQDLEMGLSRKVSLSSVCLSLLLLVTMLSYAVVPTLALRPQSLPRPHKRDYARIEALEPIVSVQDPSTILDFRQSSTLLSSILVPRTPDTPENAKVRAALLKPFQKKDRWTVEEHKFVANTPQGEKQMTNLIVTYNAGAPRTLVLAAHHDSKVTPKGFIGATDSAVPCAIIVDVALAVEKLLEAQQGASKHERGQDTSLQLIFFDGEEAYEQWTQTDSVYGSRALASTWARSFFTPQLVKRRDTPGHLTMRTIDAIDTFVLLDLLGAPHPRIPSFYHGTDWMHSELIAVEERLAKAGLLYPKDATGKSQLPPSGGWGTPLLPAAEAQSSSDQEQRHSFFAVGQPHVGGIDDDHRPFLQNGVPILHLIPTPFPIVWHQMGDDASALDYPTIHAWTMIMRVFVAEYLGLEPHQATTQVKRKREEDSSEIPEELPFLRRSVSELVSDTRRGLSSHSKFTSRENHS